MSSRARSQTIIILDEEGYTSVAEICNNNVVLKVLKPRPLQITGIIVLFPVSANREISNKENKLIRYCCRVCVVPKKMQGCFRLE